MTAVQNASEWQAQIERHIARRDNLYRQRGVLAAAEKHAVERGAMSDARLITPMLARYRDDIRWLNGEIARLRALEG